MEEIIDLDHIPVSIMRQALEDSGLTRETASLALGWGKDGARLRRALGYAKARNGFFTHVDYDIAAQMVKAWKLDPVDYGV